MIRKVFFGEEGWGGGGRSKNIRNHVQRVAKRKKNYVPREKQFVQEISPDFMHGIFGQKYLM